VIDAICAAVVFSILKNQIVSLEIFGSLVILYNVLAFGLQTLFGLVLDYFKFPRVAVISGSILTVAAALTFTVFPILAIILAGIGNALFHVGAGSICLNLTPQKASAPGIFVAPGAFGLMIGTLLGKNGQFIAWPFILVLSILCFLMFIITKSEMNYKHEESGEKGFNKFEIIILLLLTSIAIRSLVGMVLVFPWKTEINLLIVLTLAIVSGKALGGILADRFGWIPIAGGALVLSIPFIVFGATIPWLAIVGMFLFNLSMPVTLVAISNLLPGRPGFSFGLTCLALIIGTLPAFSSLKQFLGGQLFIFAIILVSVIALYCGLRKYFINFGQKKLAG
jgi:MFS transporter, FSR family, fosmidomycin resistance protein